MRKRLENICRVLSHLYIFTIETLIHRFTSSTYLSNLLLFFKFIVNFSALPILFFPFLLLPSLLALLLHQSLSPLPLHQSLSLFPFLLLLTPLPISLSHHISLLKDSIAWTQSSSYAYAVRPESKALGYLQLRETQHNILIPVLVLVPPA